MHGANDCIHLDVGRTHVGQTCGHTYVRHTYVRHTQCHTYVGHKMSHISEAHTMSPKIEAHNVTHMWGTSGSMCGFKCSIASQGESLYAIPGTVNQSGLQDYLVLTLDRVSCL